MGLNLSGIVIQKNLKNQEEILSEILDIGLEFEKEIDFETASAHQKEEGIIDVYFGKKGTLIFADSEVCAGEEYGLEKTKILTFSTSETSMAFYLAYSLNNRTIRTIMEFEGEIITDDGEELDFEDRQETSELIWDFVSHVLGEDFWEIDESEKVYRFAMIDKENPIIEQPKRDKFDFLMPISMEEFQSNYNQEEWLELWNKMMEYAKNNSLNIFNHPSKFQGNHNLFMVNLLYLKNTLMDQPELMKVFQSKIPLDAFSAIGKAYSIQFDEDTDKKMKELIQSIPTIHLQKTESFPPVDKKWWEFWKN
jgi:hypothetical protein